MKTSLFFGVLFAVGWLNASVMCEFELARRTLQKKGGHGRPKPKKPEESVQSIEELIASLNGVDITGIMPGLETDLGADWYSPLCKKVAHKIRKTGHPLLFYGDEQTIKESAESWKKEEKPEDNGLPTHNETSVHLIQHGTQKRRARRPRGLFSFGRRSLLESDALQTSRKLLRIPTKKEAYHKRFKKRPPGWDKGHPNEHDYELLDSADNDRMNYCPFQTKSCVTPDMKYKWIEKPNHAICCRRKLDCCKNFKKYIKQRGFNMIKKDWKKLPDIPKGSWGNCAIVGRSDQLLEHARGHEIDNHDVVIRFGHMKTEGYERYVGNKTDVVVNRFVKNRMDDPAAEGIKLYLYESASKSIPALKSFHCDKLSQDHDCQKSIARILDDKLYAYMTSPIGVKDRGPSSGFTYIKEILFAGFCERVDVYGMSKDCGGQYDNRLDAMKEHHSCELESWVLHYMMKKYEHLNLCVYI